MSDYLRSSRHLSRLANPLGAAAILGLAIFNAGSAVQGPAHADVPLDAAGPVEIAPAKPPHSGGSINAFVQQEWPQKPYPRPLRKYRKPAPYEGDAYGYREKPGYDGGSKYPKPGYGPEPRYEGKPGYAAGPDYPGDRGHAKPPLAGDPDRYEPQFEFVSPKEGNGGYRDGSPYGKPQAGHGDAPYAGGPKRAYGVSTGPRRPEPELPLAPDYEINRHRGFGRLFPVLDPADPNGRGLPAQASMLRELRALGEVLKERGDPEDPAGNSDMPSGYTFLGQFVDHDLTLDLSTRLANGIRGDEVANTRTPELDLDNVYGVGPIGSPYLFKLPYLRTGRQIDGGGAYVRHDLLRIEPKDRPGPLGGSATAIIGDPRDDENLIVSQLHAAFVSFHNRTVDVLVSRRYGRHRYKYCGSNICSIYRLADSLPAPAKAEIFEKARDHVLHYYHRVIAEDLLPWLIGYQRTADLFSRGRDFYFPRGFREKDGRLRVPFIPVEFAVGAFRYGHSQVHSSYQLRADYRVSLFKGHGGNGIQAFQPVTPRQLIDWRYFFEIEEAPPPGFNWARRIDPLVTPALHSLHRTAAVGPADLGSLPARNLQRGRAFFLPSGQAVAERMLPVLEARGALRDGYDRGGKGDGGWQSFLLPPNDRTRYYLGGEETPLWYYVLQEAEVFGVSRGVYYTPAYAAPFERGPRIGRGPYEPVSYGPRRGDYGGDGGNSLGPVGGTIVGEVLVGLLEHFKEKTGKGLAYDPEVRGSSSGYAQGYGRGRGGPRYLMRNFLIDAGVVEPRYRD
jgi:hypothetical protein